ncbi:hypothetical protein SAMN05443637_13055 [Pseudonocardia thermophila]|uniref:Uncharacterized protein n=1 Tax=Pseudonocardia thermophila TaxID=1848 RepID=A0A1M7AXG1_PSETH|nr:hypothetical protein [Pseudonocardia thermophila]SHL47296.1 hypothetical protein SAMN05443637_13055 [Pseudonocardia thermophila]
MTAVPVHAPAQRQMYCNIYGKVAYPSRELAEAKLRYFQELARERRFRKYPRQVYRCPACWLWHLSSQSRRQWLTWHRRRNRPH